MRTWAEPRREIDFMVEIDGKPYNLEDLLEDLNGAAREDVRFYQGDVHSDLMLRMEALTSLGGRDYPCTLGPKFESFRISIRKLLAQARADQGRVVLSDWTQGYMAGRTAHEATYTAEEHLSDVVAVLDQIAPEMARRDAYEARRAAQPEDERDPPYTAPKKLVSAFWKVSYAVPRLRLTHSLDGSGIGDVTLEDMLERLTAEVTKTNEGWSWP